MNIVEQIVRNIKGGTFATVSYNVPARMLKTNADGETNPLWNDKDNVRKVCTNVLINLGVVYGNAINGRLERKELPSDFKPLNMKGKQEHSNFHKCICQNIDRTKTYLRYMPCKSNQKIVKYMLNGNDVTSIAEKFAVVSKPAQTQTNAGLNDHETIAWNTLDIENITSINILGVTISQ